MKLLRTALFWTHLALGVAAGAVILIMSATGAVLAFKPQITNVIERDVRRVTPSDGPRLPISQIVEAARAGRAQASVTQIAVDRDPSHAVAVGFERAGTVYVNPYTATVLGEGSARTQAFFRTLENWHRWVGMSTENRATAKSITGASNLAFLALALSGVYLWWPRTWRPGHARAILAFRRTVTSRARDFNWHNVIGFWCAPVIIVMTATALVMSYPWANNLLFRLAGTPVPSAPSAGREPIRSAERVAPGDRRQSGAPLSAEALDRAWTRAETQLPSWNTIVLRVSNASAPLAFTLTDGDSWNAFARSQLTVHAATGETVRWQPYGDSSRGQKLRGWFRFAHTGELAGWPGQLLAGVACVGGVVLVWTGLALAVRRLLNARVWRGRFARDRRAMNVDAAA